MSATIGRTYSDYLLEVQSKLQWTDSIMADHLKVTRNEWDKIAIESHEPSLMALSSLAESLNENLETVFEQKIDLGLLSRRLSEGFDAMPERYIEGAFSRVRTSRPLIDFIEFYFGWRMRQKVLKTLNMNEATIADSERFININFFMDICKTVKELGYSDDILKRMGEFSVYSNRSGVVGKSFSDCATPKEIFEKTVPVLGTYYEKNHEYKILSLSESHCTMESRLQPELVEALKSNKIGSHEGCMARRGVGASFVLYAGPYRTKAHELECIHDGSDRCVFRIEWTPLAQEC